MLMPNPPSRSVSSYVKLGILVLLVFQVSCKQKKEPRKIEPAFYYWKSVLNLNSFEKERLDSLRVETIYLKFFDVAWNKAAQAPMPVAKLSVDEPSIASLRASNTNNFAYQIIPVIFITNECIQKLDTSQIAMLGDNISDLTFKLIDRNAFNNIPEIQFDCDWSGSTKDKYFKLIERFRKRFAHTPISATIRLHQVKFINRTGVPPVDRGLLMCYNMGNLKDPATKNSILESAELKKYIGGLSSYPLPVDIALPLFNWKVLYRNNRYAGLLQQLDHSALNSGIAARTGNRFRILADTVLSGYELKKGDILRDEQSMPGEIIAAANLVKKYLKNTSLRVSLYHLDSVILSKYPTHVLESFYNSLH
jgi:hypothetical protein